MTEQNMLTNVTDATGLETLEIFADTDKFNSWLFETLVPYCKNNLLEIGSGIGNISELLLKHFSEVSLSDLRPEYCEMLRQKFGSNDHLKSINLIDLSEKDFAKKYALLQNAFDTIIASNVVEHIEDDHLAIRNCRSMLRKGGRLVVLVPAYKWLYNSFDKELGHFRRYNKKNLTKLFVDEGFDIVHSQYFNFAGVFGWWFSGSVLKKKILPKNQLVLYNKLTPLIRLADKLVMSRSGLSVIVAGEKK
jgi:2-polyprenyl-3-methyl-5-hydroxy-6-metoxy-1,4-benzoquinol methylase